MKQIFKTIIASQMLLAAGLITDRAMAQPIASTLSGGLSGAPAYFSGGSYTGYVVPGSFDLTFGNPTTPALPAGALEIKAVLPLGMAFDAYTPPAGWSYTIIDPQNATLSNTAAIGYGLFPPTNVNSTAVFHIPVKALSPFVNRTYVAFLQGTGPFYTTPTPIPGVNSAQGTVSVVNNPLPVLFASFMVAAKGNCAAELSWSTAMEKNNDHFEIERSADGKKFAAIGKVAGAGNSMELQRYSFIDEQPVQGQNIYRVRQVDKDGKSTTSKNANVQLDCHVDGISVYPNPTSGIVYIKGLKDKGVARIFNSVGQMVLQKTLENTMEGINMNGLTDGIYQIQVVNGSDVVFTTKLIKK